MLVVARICGDVTGTLIISFNDRGQIPKSTVFLFSKGREKVHGLFLLCFFHQEIIKAF
jgi:hypothetical protein